MLCKLCRSEAEASTIARLAQCGGVVVKHLFTGHVSAGEGRLREFGEMFWGDEISYAASRLTDDLGGVFRGLKARGFIPSPLCG
jgi:hypothetical protein